MHRNLYDSNSRGFTLIEILIVVGIVVILASVAIVAFTDARDQARDSSRTADLSVIVKGVEVYFTNNARLPAATDAVWDAEMPAYFRDVRVPVSSRPGDAYRYCHDNASPPETYLIWAYFDDAKNRPANHLPLATVPTNCVVLSSTSPVSPQAIDCDGDPRQYCVGTMQ